QLAQIRMHVVAVTGGRVDKRYKIACSRGIRLIPHSAANDGEAMKEGIAQELNCHVGAVGKSRGIDSCGIHAPLARDGGDERKRKGDVPLQIALILVPAEHELARAFILIAGTWSRDQKALPLRNREQSIGRIGLLDPGVWADGAGGAVEIDEHRPGTVAA